MTSLTVASRPVSMHENREVLTTTVKCLFGCSPRSRRKSRDNIPRPTDSNNSSDSSCSNSVHVKKETRFGITRKRVVSNPYENVPVSPARLSVQRDVNKLPSQTSAARIPPTQMMLVKAQVVVTLAHKIRAGTASSACSTALGIPEVLECILMNLVNLSNNDLNGRGGTDKVERLKTGPLFNCLTVNSAFHATAVRLISHRVTLCSVQQLQAYSVTGASKDNLCRDLLIHRVKSCQQSQFQQISQFRLKSLELYVCPKLVPTKQMLLSGTLRKLALPGCALVDDKLMLLVAHLCPALQILDLRACELVCDEGILAIARSCKALSYLNVGRVNCAGAITDKSIVEICRTTAVETLGLAGCDISDETVLAIAQFRGTQIERLSINQCHKVSDHSLSQLLRSAPRLQVLEIVGCERTKDARTLCYFKISTGALVETSEVFALEMQLYEREVRHELERLRHRLLKSQRRVTA